jgi:hypothetical protein
LYAIFMSFAIHLPHSLFPMWRVMFIFDSRFAWSDLCSRTLSSMICLNYNEQTSVRQLYGILFILFICRNLAKFRPEKYDFELYKRFSMEKMPKFTQISRNKIQSRSPISYDKFQNVVKNIQLVSYLICSQIWLSLARSSNRWSPLQLHHKIGKKNLVYGLSYSNMVMV